MRYKTVTGAGGHPEVGDVVYKGTEELGHIEFFYYRVSEGTYAVKIADCAIDPAEVTLIDVMNAQESGVVGRTLLFVGPASGRNLYNAASALGPGASRIDIANHVVDTDDVATDTAEG